MKMFKNLLSETEEEYKERHRLLDAGYILSKEDKDTIKESNKYIIKEWETWARKRIIYLQVKYFLILLIPTVVWITLIFLLIPGSLEELTWITITKGLLGIPIPGLIFTGFLIKLTSRDNIINSLEEPELIQLEGIENESIENLKWNLRN